MKGYRKVIGLPAMMRTSYFGYSEMYPSYFNWLHHTFLVLGNGYEYEDGKFYTYSGTEVVHAAKGKRIPKEWFTKSPKGEFGTKEIKLYPYSHLCLLGEIYEKKIPMTLELYRHLDALRTYILEYKIPSVTVDYRGTTDVLQILWEVLAAHPELIKKA